MGHGRNPTRRTRVRRHTRSSNYPLYSRPVYSRNWQNKLDDKPFKRETPRRKKELRKIRQQIHNILQADPANGKKEVLQITYPKNKDNAFGFLTRTKAAGGTVHGELAGYYRNPKTNKLEIDDNYLLEIQFKDTPKDEHGERLINLLNDYNKEKIGEGLLYSRTLPISETSL